MSTRSLHLQVRERAQVALASDERVVIIRSLWTASGVQADEQGVEAYWLEFGYLAPEFLTKVVDDCKRRFGLPTIEQMRVVVEELIEGEMLAEYVGVLHSLWVAFDKDLEDALAQEYWREFSSLPIGILEEVVQECKRRYRFFPKIAEVWAVVWWNFERYRIFTKEMQKACEEWLDLHFVVYRFGKEPPEVSAGGEKGVPGDQAGVHEKSE